LRRYSEVVRRMRDPDVFSADAVAAINQNPLRGHVDSTLVGRCRLIPPQIDPRLTALGFSA
jgi:hypothetical protein